jgi:hypothetical protein
MGEDLAVIGAEVEHDGFIVEAVACIVVMAVSIDLVRVCCGRKALAMNQV